MERHRMTTQDIIDDIYTVPFQTHTFAVPNMKAMLRNALTK